MIWQWARVPHFSAQWNAGTADEVDWRIPATKHGAAGQLPDGAAFLHLLPE